MTLTNILNKIPIRFKWEKLYRKQKEQLQSEMEMLLEKAFKEGYKLGLNDGYDNVDSHSITRWETYKTDFLK